MGWQMRLICVVVGMTMLIVGIVFAGYVNIVSLYWGEVELFSSVISTLLAVFGGFLVIQGVIRG
jgi:hypothetical protein